MGRRPDRGINKKIYDLLLGYGTLYGERILHMKRHGSIHLKGSGDIRYLYPYFRMSQIEGRSDEDAERIRMFWRFMNGEKKLYLYFYYLYLRALRQMLWMTKRIGPFELAAVPKSDPDKQNPVEEICSEISRHERFILSRPVDAPVLIRRKYKMKPVHHGGKHSVREIESNLYLSRPLKAGTVILIDDMVFSGKTIRACQDLLKKNGAKRVYALCMYGYKRKDSG